MFTEKETPQRFARITDVIDVKKLERETRKFLYFGFVFAVFFHAATAIFFSFKKTEERILKPYKVDLIIKPPRLKKPFIIRKKRGRKKPLHHRDFVFRKPLREFAKKSLPSFDVHDFGDSLRIPTEMIFPSFDDSWAGPELSEKASRRKKPFYIFSLQDELLSIDDLDYGKYKAFVVKDIFNKRNIEGFIYIPASVWGAELTPLKRPVIGLAEALKRYTNITPKIDERLLLSSPDIFKFPFIYITTDEAFELNPPEKKNFLEYLKNGGFAVLDNGFPYDGFSNAEASLRQMLWDVKSALGSAAFITIIPLGHPLYHCFFDFYQGPPIGAELLPPDLSGTRNKVLDSFFIPTPYLEGLWIYNRLTAVYSDKGYGIRWSHITDNNPQLKIGVNLVVYALRRDEIISRK